MFFTTHFKPNGVYKYYIVRKNWSDLIKFPVGGNFIEVEIKKYDVKNAKTSFSVEYIFLLGESFTDWKDIFHCFENEMMCILLVSYH